MSPRLAFAIDAATRAGRLSTEYFKPGIEVELKADQTPVTVADRLVEQSIRDAIAERFPGEDVLGEEEGGATSANRWVIDPIDGTKSFICGVPLYATLLSYEENGQPILGVCYFPALEELVFAERGTGCFWNGRPCCVSTESDLARSVICCAGHKGLENSGRLSGVLSLAQQCLGTRTWCDAYGHILVATGRVEAMIDPVVSPWDISSIKVIVEEAGGRFTDFEGRATLSEEAVSTNLALHDTVLRAFQA